MDPQTLADRIEIGDLLTRYATSVDTKDWDLFRSVFTEDATIDYTSAGGEKGTVAEMAEWLSTTLPMFETTQHLIANQEVAIDGDTATVRAMFYNPMKFAGGDNMFWCGGYYNHSLVRTKEGWRSTRLVEETAWSTM